MIQMSNKTAVRKMAFCMILIVLMTAAYQALAQDDATPEVQPEATAAPPVTEAPPDNITVNIEQPPATNEAQSLITLIAIIGGAIVGGGTVWAISPRIRSRIENDPDAMDSLERRYHKGNPATRAFIDKAMAEARGWIDFQQKLSDGVLSDGTRLE